MAAAIKLGTACFLSAGCAVLLIYAIWGSGQLDAWALAGPIGGFVGGALGGWTRDAMGLSVWSIRPRPPKEHQHH